MSKIAVITGARSGIGKAVALKLQGAGYNVVLAARREAELRSVAGEARMSGGQVLIQPCDVTDEASVEALFVTARAAFGRIDVLFNNAGVFAQGKALEDISLDEWRRVVDVNLTGAFLCAREAIRHMKTQNPRGGRIINNGSISSINPRPLSAPYTATKHAISGLTKSISLDGRADSIACSQIDIGNAATDFTSKMAAGILQANGTTMVEPRMDVAHVADAVLYIANLPLEANVQFMQLLATNMPFVGRG
jgi:NAD(P)-dependent dehydrogenase (short-subunit alcohol dehydrogenase family)